MKRATNTKANELNAQQSLATTSENAFNNNHNKPLNTIQINSEQLITPNFDVFLSFNRHTFGQRQTERTNQFVGLPTANKRCWIRFWTQTNSMNVLMLFSVHIQRSNARNWVFTISCCACCMCMRSLKCVVLLRSV